MEEFYPYTLTIHLLCAIVGGKIKFPFGKIKLP